MTDVILDILDNENAALRVDHADGETHFIPVKILDRTPVGNVPLLGEVEGNYIPQELLDTLFRMRLKTDEERWWQDYFITRREDRVKYAEEIAVADKQFKENPDVSWTI